MGNEKSDLKGGGGVARLTLCVCVCVCVVLVVGWWTPGSACQSPAAVLAFAKSAQDAAGRYRREGGEGEDNI